MQAAAYIQSECERIDQILPQQRSSFVSTLNLFIEPLQPE